MPPSQLPKADREIYQRNALIRRRFTDRMGNPFSLADWFRYG